MSICRACERLSVFLWTVLQWKLLQELKFEACENIKALNILKMVDCRWLLNGSLSTKLFSYEIVLPYVLWYNNFTILIKENMGVPVNYNPVTHLQSHIVFVHPLNTKGHI